MAWVELPTYEVAVLAGPADLNTIKTNLDHLANPPLAFYNHPNGGADFTTTSVNSFVPVDPLMRLSFTSAGGPLLALLTLNIQQSNSAVPFAISVSLDYLQDYGRGGGANHLYAYLVPTTPHNISALFLLQNAAAGLHTLAPVWTVGAGSTLTAPAIYTPSFAVWEV